MDKSDLFVRLVARGEVIQGYLQREQDLNPDPFTTGLILSHYYSVADLIVAGNEHRGNIVVFIERLQMYCIKRM